MTDQLSSFSKTQRDAGAKTAGAWEQFFKTRQKDGVDRAKEINETARVAEVQDKRETELLALPNVVGVATSMKVKGDKPTGGTCLSVFVEKKQQIKKGRVPVRVDGVATDVVEVGKLEPMVFNAKVRPALPGYSMGHFNITAGTYGCLVRDLRRCCCPQSCDCSCRKEECPSDYLILSNNHVLAASNEASEGDLILQPGPIDGGVYPSDAVATLERFEPIVFGRSGFNLVDAAVARPLEGRNVTASIIGSLIPRGVNQAFIGSPVIKAGRTTQVTTGRVLAVNATVVVSGYSGGAAQFRHQILTTAMSAGGDSGSLLMDGDLNAVGLLFAGSSAITIHNHIADVETALGVRPLTAPRFG
jgi:hypothetical protein